ncbi:MAG: hypothetical protein ABSH51_29925 [Solirubrobacteraceae bacterium]|jgi:hypothetical protein
MTAGGPQDDKQEGTSTGRHAVGLLVTAVVAIVLFAVMVIGVRAEHGLGYEPAADHATTGVNVELSVFPDSMACHGSGGGPHPDWVSYCPSTNLKLPAHSTVTFTVKQYDSATTLHNTFFDTVRGTVGGTMTVNGKTMSQVSPDAPGHTFTLQTPPDSNEPYLFVNVPLLGTGANANQSAVTVNGNPYPAPNVIVFQIKTEGPGTYIWHCYVPCGTGLKGDGIGGQDNFGGPMATTGYMSGTVTVA